MVAENTMKAFFTSPKFAVIGASTDRAKYGNKVLRWYLDRNLSVTPINPKVDEIEGVQTKKSANELGELNQTSISIITPPAVTIKVLQEALSNGIPYAWLQPGSEDENVIKWVQENASNKVILGGPCILVSGDSMRAQASL